VDKIIENLNDKIHNGKLHLAKGKPRVIKNYRATVLDWIKKGIEWENISVSWDMFRPDDFENIEEYQSIINQN